MKTFKELLMVSEDCKVISSRMINRSQTLVFKAWTDPNHLKNWWGPNGFTNTFHEFDLKAGGNWQFIMHGPDGREFLNQCGIIY